VSAAVVGPEAQEDFASEAVTTVTRPALAPALASSFESTLPPTPHGTCVNCGREVTLRVVAIEDSHRTYQWVPTSEPARQGRRCSEASMPAFHWAQDATAAVYHVST
jgi:hypothetical protein